MPLGIPQSMEQEHEELHEELRRLIKMPGEVGRAAKHVAEVFHPYFDRENELAVPVVGVTKELAEGKVSADFPKEALKLSQKFKAEYEKMLKEHVEIVKALDQLERAGKKAKSLVLDFVRKLKLHAKTMEDLTYPAVLMAWKLLQSP